MVTSWWRVQSGLASEMNLSWKVRQAFALAFPMDLDVSDVRSQPDAIVPYFVLALLHTVGS